MHPMEFTCSPDIFHYSIPWSFSTPWERFQHVTFSCSHWEEDLGNFNGQWLLSEWGPWRPTCEVYAFKEDKTTWTTLHSFEAQGTAVGQGSWEETFAQFLSAVQMDCYKHFWRAMLVGAFVDCEVSTGKGGWYLYALWGFSKQGRKLDDYRSEAHNSEKLDEARFLGKMAKCEISETDVNIDRTWLWSHTDT